MCVNSLISKLYIIPCVLQCRVKGLHSQGLSVQVANHISGFIPSMHLADIPLKHPEKRFSEDDVLKCRVSEYTL
jgi:rRNA biogenesis protein RRP5